MRKVINKSNELDTVTTDMLNPGKIYVSKAGVHCYKLHEIKAGWVFCSLHNSISGASGIFDSLQKAIEVQLQFGDVYELSGFDELITWLRDNG